MSEIKTRLFTKRITIFNDDSRAQAVAALPASIRDRRITQGKLLRRVEKILHQVLQLHERGGEVELFLYTNDLPTPALWRGCVLLIPAGIADLLYDGELAGVLAHELGHAYFADDMADALRAQDSRAMRVVELKCDGVGLLSLKLLNYNPSLYVRGLHRMEAISRRKGQSGGISQSHPELVKRAQFSQRFIKILN